MVLLYRFCSLFIKNFLCIKTFSVVSGPLTLLFLHLFRKRSTQLNILSILREADLFNNVSIGFCKSTVVGNSLSFFLSILGLSLLVTFGCSCQFLQSPNHSGPSHQSLLSSQPRLPKSAGFFLVRT